MRRKFLSVLLIAAMTTTMFGCSKETDDSKNSGTSTTKDDASSDDSSDTDGDDAATPEESAPPENVVTGDASAADAFVIWGWNDDIKKVIDGDPENKDNKTKPFGDAYPDELKRIVFVNTGGSDYYQQKVDEILNSPDNEIYPDVMGLEVDYVKKYVNSDFLLGVDELGITEDDMKNMYEYNKVLGTDEKGKVKALFWQATPGCFQVRADLAKEYLGTDKPEEIQEFFKDYETIVETAKTVKEKSGGKCKILSGYDELKRPLMNSRKQGFYDADSKITIDENVTKYLELVETLGKDELTFGTAQWSTDWSNMMGGDGKETEAALAYFGCPWFTYWSLNGEPWTNNTILVQGPVQCFWGGTGLAATTGCSDKELAGTIIKALTCDTEIMVAINALNADFVNNKAAIDQIIKNVDEGVEGYEGAKTGNGKLYPDAKQNFIGFMKPLADNIDASTITAEDQSILAALDTQANEVAAGSKDVETAIEDFKAAVHDTYSYLTVE